MCWLQLLHGCGICSLSPSGPGVLLAADCGDTGKGRTCTPANSPGKPAWSWCAVKAKLHVRLFQSVEILYGLYHNSLSEITSVARNFCVGAGFGYSTMENRIFPSRLSVACFCAPLQCGVNTGPIKILLLYVLRRLLWPPVLYPSVVCFPKLWLEDHCGGLKVSVPVLHVLPWAVWWPEGR